MSASCFAQLEGERPVLLPPGNYDVEFVGFATSMLFTKAYKLRLQFKVVTMGEHFGTHISRFYNVTRLIGRVGQNGRFKVGFHGDFLREFSKLFGTPVRLDRIPMTSFERKILLARVRTVEKAGTPPRWIPEGLRYSVISELITVKEG